ncbi:hypothetical protein [Flavobacterium sp. '19STA2R22 D10 B1']|uniref:hypothetical protein n=1 Tax=Flavobacterium aerium TaxID=3037261 RepID=UPI00278C32A7|nr:hypothetical protein [Flavobacterium sp. '19STA2R22 D10 B1']
MEHLTTYTCRSRNSNSVWLFKYYLNGDLKGFEVLSGTLSQKQIIWLFTSSNFPVQESIIEKIWIPKLKDNFEIVKAAPILDFENLWNLYGLKVNKDKAEKVFLKLSDGDKVKCFLSLKAYEKYLQRTNQAKAHLVTWINQKRFNDEY